MKLVIATPLYPPDIGGPATYAALLSKGLIEKGHTVSLVKFGDVRHMPKVIRHLAYFFHVLRALKSADAVLALDPVSVGLPTYIAARRMKKPFVVKIVGDYAWEQGRQRFGVTMSLDEFVNTRKVPLMVRFLRKVQTRVAKSAAFVIVPSEYLKKIVNAWGVTNDDIHVIYNAVSGGEKSAVPQPVAELSRPIVVTAGRLVLWKRIDGIIDAVAHLRTENTKKNNSGVVSLVVVGDGPECARLSTHAKEVLGNDYLFTGALSHAELLAVIQSADVFVLNSSYEGLSHTLIEALACASPIIATRVGGNEEVLDGYSGAIFVSGHDESELSDALGSMILEKNMRSRLQTEASHVAKRFSPEAMSDTTISALSKLL